VGLRIEIDRQSCMASGNCSLWAPGVFDHDGEGIAVVVDPDGEPEEQVVTAAQNCPKRAIAVSRDGERLV
jgi:ferredoxin